MLPYLQSFCNLEERGAKERRKQRVVERNDGREDVLGAGNEVKRGVKIVGKADRKPRRQKQMATENDKKLSIHERLEINKKIIKDEQGKDKPKRGVDHGVR